jgi:hypothetical protein
VSDATFFPGIKAGSDGHRERHPPSSLSFYIMLPALALILSVAATACMVSGQATYNGGYTDATQVRLRIGNGGAGQSGLIGAWANAFIQYMVQKNGTQPFLVSAVVFPCLRGD